MASTHLLRCRYLGCAPGFALGYAGWSAGQLEHEIAQNAWLTVPADLAIVFDLPPEERLAAAMQLLGIDFTRLSDVAGHA